MAFFDRLFRRSGGFQRQRDDLQMWTASRRSGIVPHCECLAPQTGNGRFGGLVLHPEVQDTQCEGWKVLLDLVEKAASRRSKEFAPGLEMSPELWSQVITLPPSISKLTSVRKLSLY